MSVRAAWERLGIAPTAEARDVKRAYARLLKEIDADADPAGFIALREAYEVALASGGVIPDWERDDWDPEQDDWDPELDDDSYWASDSSEFQHLPHGSGFAWNAQPWRPPAPHMASGDLGAACRTLDRLLFQAAENEPEAIAAAGTELLRALDGATVDEAAEVELWLASAIGSSIPRSDPLVSAAIRRFGWDSVGGARHNWDVELVLDRAQDLPFARKCRNPASPHHRAYAELTGPPRAKVGLFELGLAQDVRELLTLARNSYSTLERDFTPETLDWWNAYFRGPHLPSFFWLIVLLVPLLLTSAGVLAFGPGAAAAVFVASAVLVPALIVGWSRVRPALRQRADERRWRRVRWERRTTYCLGGALLLPPLAAAAPAGVLSGVAIAAAALPIFSLLWRDLPPPLDEDEAARSMRQYGAIAAGAAGVALMIGLPQPPGFNLILPIVALMLAASAGHEVAAIAFERLERGTRIAILAGTAAAALLLAIPFVLAVPALPPPWLAMLVPVVVVVQHLATAASRVATPYLDWPIRIVASVFYFFPGRIFYEADTARAMAAAVCLYAICYSVVRIGIVASAALDARPPAGAD